MDINNIIIPRLNVAPVPSGGLTAVVQPMGGAAHRVY